MLIEFSLARYRTNLFAFHWPWIEARPVLGICFYFSDESLRMFPIIISHHSVSLSLLPFTIAFVRRQTVSGVCAWRKISFLECFNERGFARFFPPSPPLSLSLFVVHLSLWRSEFLWNSCRVVITLQNKHSPLYREHTDVQLVHLNFKRIFARAQKRQDAIMTRS